eukprot:2988807-Ditylum_brightwellii.AAC.1
MGENGDNPCRPLFKPLVYLLSSCDDTKSMNEKGEAVWWILEGDGKSDYIPEFIDAIFTRTCWSLNSMGSCLHQKSNQKMKDEEGEVTCPMAYSVHEPVLNHRRELAELHDIQEEEVSISPSWNSPC